MQIFKLEKNAYMSETYQGIFLLWWQLTTFFLLLFPAPIKLWNAVFRRWHRKLPHSWPVVAITTRKLVPRGCLTNSVSNLELFHQVLGTKVLLLTEWTSWEVLVQTAGSGKEYRVSATPNTDIILVEKKKILFCVFPLILNQMSLHLKLSLIHANDQLFCDPTKQSWHIETLLVLPSPTCITFAYIYISCEGQCVSWCKKDAEMSW